MKIEALKDEKTEDFIMYCKKHRMEIDDSFLYDEDLKDFKIGEENPTYIVTDYQEKLIAAISLIVDDYARRDKKARFRIFHSEIEDISIYNMLMKAILNHTKGLDKVSLFVPAVNKKLIGFIERLNFAIERYSFILVRDDMKIPELNLPQDYEIRPFQPGKDEKTWCDVRNAGFAKLQGSEAPINSETVTKMISSDDNIEGGMMILYHKDKPVGIVRGSADEYEDLPIMNIGPLAVIPEYQGKGLGRILLRASLNFAKERAYNRTILCVNAENERARALYLQEGFKQVEKAICYKYDLRTKMK
ncbi:GNAT family N-acetyltransferase [Acidilutibacter cellobiosedens]|uniref:GNAT family N-acetyltransferase n=1 Tax=Acidilutibacter cellobiosedens TaxID=2507161 RepID=A0A410Q8E0_9FIRM|nr:GNAT family N-acetyltransferase [Acidilutibacter cellobiosedens]QAT60206.1 GNAT family N-acetyltransferase [Acidilutibacter cellobiosedens]